MAATCTDVGRRFLISASITPRVSSDILRKSEARLANELTNYSNTLLVASTSRAAVSSSMPGYIW
jgi:hypothetical protein